MSQKTFHDSAQALVQGRAEYVDDRSLLAGEMHVDLVLSSIACGKIKKMTFEEAAQVPGVLGIFSAQDLHHNRWGSIFKDQPLLAKDRVQYLGEVILVLAGETREALFQAKKLIRIEYEVEAAVLSIDEAHSKKMVLGPERIIETGQPDLELQKSTHQISGIIQLAGQDHFYLESQACIVYPKEAGQLEIHSSSQHPSEVQHLVAEALGLKFHQVVCIVKRMGGGFGGKESQAAPFAVYAALAAKKLNRPARLILTKDDDMLITGKRNPFQIHYKVGFDQEGKIKALLADLFSDGGAYADLSTAIMERAMLHSDNAYFLPAARIRGQVCKTNTSPSTAFRGFGGPKGMLMIENVLDEVAHHLKKDPLKIRELNVYQKGDRTPYGQEIEDEVLPQLLSRIKSSSDYSKRRAELVQKNKQDPALVYGLGISLVKFGISFTTRFLNQGAALVNLHMDGTLQVSTGAAEMGQGVNTKIAQVVAEAFGVSTSAVNVMPTSTEKIHNTSATAASSGADINAGAALLASEEIKTRLLKVAEAVLSRPKELRGRVKAGAGSVPELKIEDLPKVEGRFLDGRVEVPAGSISLTELIEEAYLNRVHLGAMGFFRYPGIYYNKEIGQGQPFYYFANGAAVSEVSLDTYTGEVKVIRSDLLMDLGRSLNPGIDQGQVIGAFVQGLGWLTTEKLHYSKEGRLLTISPSTYKIPSVHDIPRDLRVSFLENDLNAKNVRGSKAVGEPPLMLAISVWTAIKNALQTVKGDSKISMKVPATQEDILMALES